MSNKKINGFTIIEIIIVMIISTIVTTSGYYAYNRLSLYFENYINVRSTIADIEVLSNNLQFHFFDSRKTSINNNQIIFSKPNKEIEYFFNDGIIENSINPNSYIKIQTIEFLGYWQETETNSGLIDELKLTLLYENDTIRFHLFKDYALDIIIDNNNS